MERQNGESDNKVAQAGGKLQGEVLADESQGAGNVEAKKVNDPVDQAIEEAKEFGGYQARSAEVIEKIAADRDESIEKGRAADDVSDTSKDELGWAANDVTDESKDERSKGAEIEDSPGFREKGNGLDAKGAEAPSKVEAAIVRQELEPELSKVLDLESEKSGLLALASRLLQNAQNLDSWVSAIAIGIVATGSIVVLWDSRRKA